MPLDRSDVDTDQIIPSDWLKRVERTGFEKGLFSEWRDDPTFVLNDERYAGANDPRRRPELRHRLVARARGVGDPGLRLRGRDLAPLRRHLPQQLPPRTASCRCVVDAEVGERLLRGGRGRPDARARRSTSSAARSRRRPSASTSSSRSTTPSAQRFLEGLDDIGITLQHEDAITAFETARPDWLGDRQVDAVEPGVEQVVELLARHLLGEGDEVVGVDVAARRARRPTGAGS